MSYRVGLTVTETIVMEFGNFDFKKHPSKCSSLLFKREMSFFFLKLASIVSTSRGRGEDDCHDDARMMELFLILA